MEAKRQGEVGKRRKCNSKFFHRVANGKRNRKYIKVLESKERTLLDNINILEEILHFF